MSLPYLLKDFAGIGGKIKVRPEDFFVQEIPLYEPAGAGEHVYVEIQKIGIPTFEAIHRLAHALNVSPRDIGYAGMKDAQAISRQMLSIWGTSEEAVMNVQVPGITIEGVARHNNKLRLGHLKGNRFAIKIRDVNPTDVVRTREALRVIEQRGMPNYFGEQRFGRRGNNDVLGAALVRGDYEAVLKGLLGGPNREIDDRMTLEAREAFDAGELEKSMKAWPRRSGVERRILARLIKTKKPAAAVRAIDEKLRRLWVSALQSRIFNDVVARRIESLDQVLPGDLAWKHDNGACFIVQDAAAEQARAAAGEISPTGPLIGYRMSLPEEAPLRIETEIFQQHGLRPEDFRREGKEKVKGARRPLRVRPENLEIEGGADTHGPHITLAFTLPAGSFATVLLREVMKTEDVDESPIPATSAQSSE
jgi:tRNA pseudouridine13 synthase